MRLTRSALVTGAAGFIGSHLAERLVRDGWRVVGVDCFTDYYPRAAKERNLAGLTGNPSFCLVEADLATADLRPLVSTADVVFHEAGQAGVRASWGAGFETYLHSNVLGTQRLLEAARGTALHRLVYASSSSIYGDASQLPITEDTPPHPLSPYGVTKLAGEHLCQLYATNHSVPTTVLRYFTVYGPRQRPDMAFHRLIRSMLRDRPFLLYGDGEQTRDFTYVDDAVDATVRAADVPPGSTYNIAGGARVTMNQVILALEELMGRQSRVERSPSQAGDARHTWADTTAARAGLGYSPLFDLRKGLEAEIDWLQGTAQE